MRLRTFESLAVTWLLMCFIGLLRSDPQQSYWISYETQVPENYPSHSISSQELFQQEHQKYDRYQGYQYPEEEYKNVGYFQENQRKKLEVLQRSSQDLYGSYGQDLRSYPSKNTQEFNYENLLEVTPNPSRLQDYQDPLIEKHEREIYYQDYLPLENPKEIKTSKDEIQEPQMIQSKQSIYSRNDSKDEKILKKVDILVNILSEERYVPTMEDMQVLNALEDQMIAQASVPEEAKRVARQVRMQRPGLFWTLARITFEAANDTKSAIQQIREIINNNFAPESTSQRLGTSLVDTTTTPAIPINENRNNDTISTTTTTTTTEEPFRLTRTQFQGIVRRNLRGLIRLFNIEWRDALNQSQISANEFHRDLGNQIRPYLQDNPEVN